MTAAVVFAFAVADGLLPVAGAAPYDVLSRQIPRLLVTRLNGGADRGVRFFPFLGKVDGERTFLRLGDLLDPTALARLHEKAAARLFCDGILRQDRLHFRVLDGRDQRVLADAQMPFDPRRPLEAIPRLEFDLMGWLGWTGRPQPAPTLAGEALGWFLVLKDALLRREAGLGDSSPDPLRPARRCVELAAHEPDVQEIVATFAANLLRAGERRGEVAQLLASLAAAVSGPSDALDRLSVLLQAAGDDERAAATALRAAELAPSSADRVERAAALLFRVGRDGDVRALVETARQQGAASDAALAQLAAVCDRTGDRAGRRSLTDELLARGDLPVPVARLVVSFLLEEGRAALARDVAARALAHEPRHAMLQFEFARASLLLEDTASAARALRTAIEIGVVAEAEGQARRLLRLATVPGLWAGSRAVEQALSTGDFDRALEAARELAHGTASAAESWYLLGLVEHRRGQDRRAERLLRRALRTDDGCADAHNRLGILLLSRGNLDEAHAHLQRAHTLAPYDASTLLHLAQACMLRGDLEVAAGHVAAAERLGAEPALVAAVRRAMVEKPA